jgi:hypothetical protein
MKFASAQLGLWPDPKTKETNAAGEPRLIIRLCAHMLESGRLCRQPAVRGRRHCRAHILLQVRRLKMARAHRRAGQFRLPTLLTDSRGVQAGLARVRSALDGGHLEPEMARTLRYALRLVAFCTREMEWEQAAQAADGSGRDDAAVAAKSNGNYGVAPASFGSRGYDINTS